MKKSINFTKFNFCQIANLNLSRLQEAELVANDYLAKSNMTQLSPHYLAIIYNLSVVCPNLKKLFINADLSIEETTRSIPKHLLAVLVINNIILFYKF